MTSLSRLSRLDLDVGVRVGSMQGFRSLVRRLGGNPDDMLRRHQINPEKLWSNEVIVPAPLLINLHEYCANILEAHDFGLQLAIAQEIDVLGPLAMAIKGATTPGDAIRAASSYLFLHSSKAKWSLLDVSVNSRVLRALCFEFAWSNPAAVRQSQDLFLGLVHRILNLKFGSDYPLAGVNISHAPLASPSRYQEFFGVPVAFGQPCAALIFEGDYLAQPITEVHPKLDEFIVHYMETRFPEAGHSIALRVRQTLKKSLEINNAELDSVAQMLGIHPRRLQRKLADEGTSFEQLRDDVRRDAANLYLTTTRMSLTQISAAIGLSEQSALTRCCKAWFGMPPLKYRRQSRGEPAVALR